LPWILDANPRTWVYLGFFEVGPNVKIVCVEIQEKAGEGRVHHAEAPVTNNHYRVVDLLPLLKERRLGDVFRVSMIDVGRLMIFDLSLDFLK
jgi:hypothetical protein